MHSKIDINIFLFFYNILRKYSLWVFKRPQLLSFYAHAARRAFKRSVNKTKCALLSFAATKRTRAAPRATCDRFSFLCAKGFNNGYKKYNSAPILLTKALSLLMAATMEGNGYKHR